MAEYIALIHKDADSDFGASFPDFPGVVTAAPTLEELRKEAEEALALHIEGLIEDGAEIPEPSLLDAVTQIEDYRDALAVLAVVAPGTLSVRDNITLPESILKRIDQYAGEHGLTRSGFLARAARKELNAA